MSRGPRIHLAARPVGATNRTVYPGRAACGAGSGRYTAGVEHASAMPISNDRADVTCRRCLKLAPATTPAPPESAPTSPGRQTAEHARILTAYLDRIGAHAMQRIAEAHAETWHAAQNLGSSAQVAAGARLAAAVSNAIASAHAGDLAYVAGLVGMAGPSTAPAAADQGREFRTLQYPPDLAPYIAYDRIAQTAREVGAAFTVTYAQDGAATVRIFWSDGVINEDGQAGAGAGTVYTLTEIEPDSEFPAVVLGVYTTRAAAEAHKAARIAQWESRHGDHDEDDDSEISWGIEETATREDFDPARDLPA